MDILELNNMTIVTFPDLAKTNNIHKGISKYKKKEDLINYIFKEINFKKERESVNESVPDVFEEMDSENIEKDEINEIVDNFVDKLTEDVNKITLNSNPQYYYHKYDYLNNDLSIKSIEILLQKRLNFGDIIQFNDYRAIGCFIVTHDKLLQCSGYVSDDIYIPLEISEEFENPIELYKDIHVDFYGIELSRTNKYIIDNLGIFDAPRDWKYYYVNQEIFENEIHIDIGMNEPIQIGINIEEPVSKYVSFVNSIDYVKKLYKMHNSDNESYSLYVTLKNEDDENLSTDENDYIYNIEIPEYCIMNIDFQCDYYDIRFTFLRKDKTNAMSFINEYYFSKIPEFVKEIEPVIED